MSCNGKGDYECEPITSGEFPLPDGERKKKSTEVLEIEKKEKEGN